MVKYEREVEHSMEFVCIDNLVPEDHILRQVEKYIDFSFVRERYGTFILFK